ncbi:putative baseplate assembly protein [Mangrovactinospora gilvigrisea]|uniref:Putative baseplate assembly protein n=1 Tax=Mangrovactinospora gilvigrisea TaxID=1428644 RepID=A0A1J7BCI8_9ACTN|nr:putative baseplate assembly protein [Mangrovactinospora gilvigrisea]OIV36366.1 putative baseplate assembly protein [Mangrovactinospora gilvigrisea]
MALPAPNLDDRRFQQFVDDAKRYVQRRCPEWTDHNVSDPGVTLIEAVAHMLDQVSYRFNRVPDRNYLAFLDLLGVTLYPAAAARAEVTFRLSAPRPQPVVLAAGTEVATRRTEVEDAVVFATAEELRIVPCDLDALLVQPAPEADGGAGRLSDRTTEMLDGKDVPVFSAPPREGDALMLGLTAPVPHCLVALRLDSRVDGVGVDPRQPPLRWEAWTADGWTACEVEEDTTGGLNRPGEVLLHVPGGHAASRIGRREAGWLRCRVVPAEPGQPFYSVSPTVRSASAFTIGGTTLAEHAETVREEVLGSSSGVPGQRFSLAHGPVVAGEPPVLVQTARAGADDGDGGWQDWAVVPDFAGSGPEDRHVTLDAATGEVSFGPAVRQSDGALRAFGAVPPRDAVVRAARYRIGGGRRGNVARGAINVLRSSVPFVAEVVNREAASGGVDAETVDEAKLRAPITLRTQERAVTQRDYEELARRAAPGVARLRCLAADDPDDAHSGGPGAVRVLVVPQAVPDEGGRLRFEQLVPDDELLAAISRHLDERRPIGTRLAVGPPFYQGVTVVAVVHAFAGASGERVRTAAQAALHGYLDPLTGGPDGTGWPFGRPVHAGEVYAVLQRVPGVELVDEVQLHPADPLTGLRGEATDRVQLAAGALVFPFDHRVRVIA